MSQVKKNDKIKVHYTGKLNNGEIFDSSVDREPLEFQVGQGQIIPGFENGVLDMKLNEKKTLVIPSEEAYGEPREDLIHEIAKERSEERRVGKEGRAQRSQEHEEKRQTE